jgi:hypothetical protein
MWKKRLLPNCSLIVVTGIVSIPALAVDSNRRIFAEIDPIAPASMSYDERVNGMTSSKYGGNVDFNIAGVLSTGPEIWTGTFVVKGPTSTDATYRREDMWPGERQKLDSVRLRWNFTAWENPFAMYGWYVKSAYSYLRVNSRANRYTEVGGTGDAIPVVVPGTTTNDETDLVTDIRHGVAVGFGNRWLFLNNSLSLTIGTSATGTFKRAVSVDSKDPMARSDYDHMIEDIPDSRMSVRPSPEVNLTVGYGW